MDEDGQRLVVTYRMASEWTLLDSFKDELALWIRMSLWFLHKSEAGQIHVQLLCAGHTAINNLSVGGGMKQIATAIDANCGDGACPYTIQPPGAVCSVGKPTKSRRRLIECPSDTDNE